MLEPCLDKVRALPLHQPHWYDWMDGKVRSVRS